MGSFSQPEGRVAAETNHGAASTPYLTLGSISRRNNPNADEHVPPSDTTPNLINGLDSSQDVVIHVLEPKLSGFSRLDRFRVCHAHFHLVVFGVRAGSRNGPVPVRSSSGRDRLSFDRDHE